mmetsp:Transcript_22610/g.63491  ORF Transcript_22610/g.63491 Transcript_22610/m.63491 type:complete len:204 (-) Transcript_22610:274-885(-)
MRTRATPLGRMLPRLLRMAGSHRVARSGAARPAQSTVIARLSPQGHELSPRQRHDVLEVDGHASAPEGRPAPGGCREGGAGNAVADASHCPGVELGALHHAVVRPDEGLQVVRQVPLQLGVAWRGRHRDLLGGEIRLKPPPDGTVRILAACGRAHGVVQRVQPGHLASLQGSEPLSDGPGQTAEARRALLDLVAQGWVAQVAM